MNLIFKHKVAVVAGGNKGLGKAIARSFAKAGASLLIVARDLDALRQTAEELLQSGASSVSIHQADLTDLEAAARCVSAAVDEFGGIDILVNCAGATKRGDFFELTDADWSDGYGLKFHGAVRMCRAAWPHLVERSGCIINIAGVSVRTPTADFTIGASVNAALLSFSKSLADLGIKDGVRINVINPGYIDSERLQRRVDALASERKVPSDDIRGELLASYGINRFGAPDEIGQVAVFLATDQAAYIHGAAIDIDGGATRGL